MSYAPPVPDEQKKIILDEIMERIIGGESLIAICKEKKMPNKTTVLRWLDDPSLSATYTRARELQADGYADEINDIANKVMLGEIDPSAAKVAIDAKKWAAGKLRRGMYGDAAQVDVAQTVTYNVSEQDRALLSRYLALKGGSPDGGRIENYGNEIIDAQGAVDALPCDRLRQPVD